MRRWMAALPLTALLVIGAVTALQLYNPEKATFDTADSGTITRSAPERSFPTLSGDADIRFSPPPEGRHPTGSPRFGQSQAPLGASGSTSSMT